MTSSAPPLLRRRPASRRLVRAAAVVMAASCALLSGCSSSSNKPLTLPVPTRSAAAHPVAKPSGTPIAKADRSPLAGQSFFVNPNSHANIARNLLLKMHEDAEAALINTIARQPTAVWFAGSPQPAAAAAAVSAAAAKAHRTGVFVVYDVPQRDCGQHSAGGARDPAQYLSYVSQFASGLRGPSVVILEPDAIAFTLSGCAAIDAVQRYHLLGQAVDILLASRRDVKVYIDAGNSSWIADVGKLANALQASGVERAAGFSLNVSNYNRTSDTVAYGRKVSARLKGSHFIVDTSRNGAGPLADGNKRTWCNPAGRRLGVPPTSTTALARVDAFLWVKQPGDSDGQCSPGQPKAGQWWETGALALLGH